MTFADRVEVLTKSAYTQRQAEFLVHAALHGGYFMRRQYNRFAGTTSGGVTNRLLDKLRSRSEITVALRIGDVHIYHLSSRPFYAKLGEEHNRNRRAKQPRIIKQRLMILDFVLDHPEWHFLPTEQEKVEYFAGLPVPETVYRSRRGAPPTTRYFVDKNPVFLVEQNGKPGFAFVDEGMVTTDGFETWLKQYRPLFHSLPGFSVVYVASTAAHFGTAARRFRNVMASFPDLDLDVLLQYFEDRDLADRKVFHALGNVGLDPVTRRQTKPRRA